MNPDRYRSSVHPSERATGQAPLAAASPGPGRPSPEGLRAAGRYLDQQGGRLTSLSVVAEGISVALAPQDIQQAATAMLLNHDALAALSAHARALRGHGNAPSSPHQIFPTGYEDFLRALNVVVERKGWTWLRLVTLEDKTLLLNCGVPLQRRKLVLTADHVWQLLDQAFRLRGRQAGGVRSQPPSPPEGGWPQRDPLGARQAKPVPLAAGGLSGRQPYSVILDAIGYYVTRTKATDVHITELTGGVLVTCLQDEQQHAVPFDGAALAQLHAEAVRQRDGGDQMRTHLRAVGRHLDERHARAIEVQKRSWGYAVQFTGLCVGARSSDLRGLSRLEEHLDARRLALLAASARTFSLGWRYGSMAIWSPYQYTCGGG
jgi:hypothetical protein